MVTKTMTVNTVHLSNETLEMLADEAVLDETGATSEKHFEFLRVNIFGNPNVSGPQYLIDVDRDGLNNALDEDDAIPDDLRLVLREAFVEWCDTIRLRDNGPVYKHFPKYNCD